MLKNFSRRFASRSDSLKTFSRLHFPILWLILVLLLEVFFFNFPSFHLVGGKYEKVSLPLTGAIVEGGEIAVDGSIEANAEKLTLEWNNINRPVGTVFLNMTLSDAVNAELRIDASDDTNAAYRYGIASAKLVSFDKRSHTVLLRMSGNVHDLRLSVTVPEGSSLHIDGVTVNSPMPFRFSLLRVGLFMLVGIFVWRYLAWKPMRLPCSQNKRRFDVICDSVTLICLIAALLMVCLYASSHSNGLASELRLTYGNQITQELVDAFEHGQVHLLTDPSKELLEMENPYDWSARKELGVSYLWDHCLYNGKYYSYYGIAPVLLLFLPYHLLTGYYFSTILSILIFGGIGICFLSMTYKVFIRKFFPNIPLRLAIFGLLTLHMSSGIWYCFCAMNFYEIAQSSGFCFVTMGAYFLLSANVIGDGRIAPVRIALATTCLSLAVLSRPTTVVYCIVSLIFLGFGLKKQLDAKKSKIAVYLLSAIIPFALLGGLQMVYNYLRFDSFFDFGIQYSLTINDFTQSQYYGRFVSIGLYNYLLAPPIITPEFPYVSSNFQMLHPNGYYFRANAYATGLIWRVSPVLGLLPAPKALKKLQKEKRLPAILLIGSFSVIAPFIIMFSIWESGYGARYAIDFTWEILIGALAVIFYLYEKSENNGLRSLSSKIALWSLLPTAVINFALTYDFFMNEVNSSIALFICNYLNSIFNFWY